MSSTQNLNLICGCGQLLNIKRYRSVNITIDPELKTKVFSGAINRIQCPKCKINIKIDEPFLYQDQNQNLMAWVYPCESQVDLEKEIKQIYELDAQAMAEIKNRFGENIPPERFQEMSQIKMQAVKGIEQLEQLIGKMT